MGKIKADIFQDENKRVDTLASRIEALITEARSKVVSFVNTAMVYTYYEICRMIAEDEQGGDYRAEYGKNLNLKLMRISDPAERSFYEIEATQNHWSLRELQ